MDRAEWEERRKRIERFKWLLSNAVNVALWEMNHPNEKNPYVIPFNQLPKIFRSWRREDD